MFPADRNTRIVDAFLRALWAGDAVRALASLHEDAVVNDEGREYSTSEVQVWAEAHVRTTPRGGRTLSRRSLADTMVVTVLSGSNRVKQPAPLREWTLRAVDGQILCVNIESRPCPELPAAIAEFVEAVNKKKVAAILETFAENALVNDEFVDYWRIDEIEKWIEKNVIAKSLRLFVVGVVKHGDRTVVTFQAFGDFEGTYLPDPLVLTSYYSIEHDKIAQMIVLQNPMDD